MFGSVFGGLWVILSLFCSPCIYMSLSSSSSPSSSRGKHRSLPLQKRAWLKLILPYFSELFSFQNMVTVCFFPLFASIAFPFHKHKKGILFPFCLLLLLLLHFLLHTSKKKLFFALWVYRDPPPPPPPHPSTKTELPLSKINSVAKNKILFFISMLYTFSWYWNLARVALMIEWQTRNRKVKGSNLDSYS